jgi:hypothetical protein
MKYLKEFEIHHNDIPFYYYEKDNKGKDTGYRIGISYNEYTDLVEDGLIQVISTLGGKLYYLRKGDRDIIEKRLELLRSANKYNL